MGESLVADAGPLSAFGRIQRLELLPQVLGEVLVPHTVAVDRLADPSMHSSKRTFEALNQFARRLHCRGLLQTPVADAYEVATDSLRAHGSPYGGSNSNPNRMSSW